MTTNRTPYPPCFNDWCSDRACCAKGYKYEWPDLVGKDGQHARGVIEADNPLVTVVILPVGVLGRDDFCCNRVYVHLDADSKVRTIPLLG